MFPRQFIRSPSYCLTAVFLSATCGDRAGVQQSDPAPQRCAAAGEFEVAAAPELATPCCANLVRVDAYEASLLAEGRCIVSKGGLTVCIHCGDGVCGDGENVCNCAADCSGR